MANLKINQLITPYNFTNASRKAANITGIVIHYVGALGGAEDNCKYYARQYVGASAHYYVGFNGEYWQSVKDEDIAWHSGASSYKHPSLRNSNTIGIEMCVRKKSTRTMNATDKDWYYEDKTVAATIELVKFLMKKYSIKAANVVRHYDITGKICPNPYVYDSTKHKWADFKQAITSASTASATPAPAAPKPITPAPSTPTPATPKPSTPAASGSSFKEYKITTTCNVLNIRAGAGTGYAVTGRIAEVAGKKKEYTIAEEKSGWGRLKSGGWISLTYAKRVGAAAASAKAEYKINTTCDVLNIRVGAGTSFRITGSIAEKAGKKKIYTIVEEKNGWGKLKSGAGWISLGFTKKV